MRARVCVCVLTASGRCLPQDSALGTSGFLEGCRGLSPRRGHVGAAGAGGGTPELGRGLRGLRGLPLPIGAGGVSGSHRRSVNLSSSFPADGRGRGFSLPLPNPGSAGGEEEGGKSNANSLPSRPALGARLSPPGFFRGGSVVRGAATPCVLLQRLRAALAEPPPPRLTPG